MSVQPRPRRGFTIVELLVVIAVIAILMGLIVSGLSGAYKTAKKIKESNYARSLYVAWTCYTKNSGESLLPGYLDEATQSSWRVSYRNQKGNTLPAALTQTYPWRLQSCMDNSYEMLLGYLGKETASADDDVADEWQPSPGALPAWMSPSIATPGSLLAYQPAFGYNAYYLGGWYDSSGGSTTAKFQDSQWVNANGSTVTDGLVARSDAQVLKPEQMVAFASATFRPRGTYKAGNSTEDLTPGCAWVVPPFLAQTEIWRLGSGPLEGLRISQRSWDRDVAMMLAPTPAPAPQVDPNTLTVLVDQGVPARRYNKQVSIVTAAGNTESVSANDLINMERWIRSAWTANFRHDP